MKGGGLAIIHLLGICLEGWFLVGKELENCSYDFLMKGQGQVL